MSHVDRVCKYAPCSKVFTARSADVKRGWALFCCKACKASEQESRTGQNRAFIQRAEAREDRGY